MPLCYSPVFELCQLLANTIFLWIESAGAGSCFYANRCVALIVLLGLSITPTSMPTHLHHVWIQHTYLYKKTSQDNPDLILPDTLSYLRPIRLT